VKFITDMGGPVTATTELKDADNNVIATDTVALGRYGVWEDHGPGTANVIAVSDSLDALQAEYGPDLRVIDLTIWRSGR